jgi:type II secretory pathway pseudopilin PulG
LLIVVAIIAILAAIAVPNFLEAQVRSKVSRARADMRSLATALESYATDYTRYPNHIINSTNSGTQTAWYIDQSLQMLTTPVAYMSSLKLADPFEAVGFVDPMITQHTGTTLKYVHYRDIYEWATPYSTSIMSPVTGFTQFESFCLWSIGPDRVWSGGYWAPIELVSNQANDRAAGSQRTYDPTNGTVSNGDIFRVGGALGGAKVNG